MQLEAALRIADILDRRIPGCNPLAVTDGRLANLVFEVLGEEATRFDDGRMLIWNLARHDGYNIPPYPMAGCGDVKEFLADEGARNVPDWYRVHLGMDRASYDLLYQRCLVMVRNRERWRKVFDVPHAVMDARGACGGELAAAVREFLAFALSQKTPAEDPTLFKR